MPEDDQAYRTVRSEQTARLTVARSEFIARVRRVESQKQAKEWVKDCKNRWKDASHNCSAYVVGRDGQHQFCDDNGEPHGSAGRPILGAILSLELTNVAIVVTRYFGGKKLGVRGLIDAYAKTAHRALAASGVVEVVPCSELRIAADYNQIDRIQYLLREANAQVMNQTFAQDVQMLVSVPEAQSRDLSMRLRPFAKEVHLV